MPINLSSDGWKRGIVPGVSFAHSRLSGTIASAELRAYSLLPTRNCCYFPRLGIGASLALAKDFDFEPLLPQASVYAYLPGLWKTSGLGLSLNYSTGAFENETISKSAGITLSTTEAIVNYAIPFLSVDWNGLSPITYIRNFEFIPKASFTHYDLKWDPAKITPSGGPTSYKVWTAGAAFHMVVGNIWFIPYNFRIGVSASYVWGNPDPTAKPYEIKFVFNTDLL